MEGGSTMKAKSDLLFTQGTIFLAVSLLLLVFGCVAPTTYTKIWYEMDPSTPETQAKDNVMITVKYVEKSYEAISRYPEFSVHRERLPTEGGSWGAITSADKNENLWYEFPGITIFHCTLGNGTGHILRMRDARAYLVASGKNFPALQKQELGEPGPPLDSKWRIELKKLVTKNRRLKLINDFSTEILPGQTYEGFLFFEVDPAEATSGKLSFFDVTTRTDAAGNPTKKTTFEWKIIQRKAVVSAVK